MRPRSNPEMLPGMPPPSGGLYSARMMPPKDLRILDDLLICTLVVGFNLAIKLAITKQFEEQKLKDLQKEKLETELAFLRNQLSPHFFMNTLNNIHALIDVNSGDAKDSVIRLSKLMRYLLYESDEEKTSLKKEIEFIKSYVDLMKLRYTEEVKIELSFPENIPSVKIPPMLFTSLLENAFKHGVSYQKDSFVKIAVETEDLFLIFRISNTKNGNTNLKKEYSGIGLENLKKRLDLIYGTNYSLIKNETDTLFEISIKLPVNE
ncbi:histidine kinase [Draconibacterium sp. IB214405]|uniref:sensor histidine kinase n=1 Tax=Draconibacterium sp. IB214405 TaxID=3097352 RepID=UPI002A146B5E|nr:histidine kinase [Draconibacterium sp. IB214405]MDX8340352.1 histidine kinase [Draconibacterium sp. IB214405]